MPTEVLVEDLRRWEVIVILSVRGQQCLVLIWAIYSMEHVYSEPCLEAQRANAVVLSDSADIAHTLTHPVIIQSEG